MENLAFDGRGRLYVSLPGEGILAFLPDGTATPFAEAPVHGLVMGADGRVYAAAWAQDAWDVLAFSSDGTAETLPAGTHAFNGMAFDGDGNLYVSHHDARDLPSIVRIRPGGVPEPWSWEYSVNGLFHDAANRSLLAAVSFDSTSRILRFPLDDPAHPETVAALSFGAFTLGPGLVPPPPSGTPVAPKGLDDLALGPDGRIYVAAHLAGEVLRVDPADGSACVLASGFRQPTSVRFAIGFGEHDGDLFVTTFGGTTFAGALPREPALWVIETNFALSRAVEDSLPGGPRDVPAAGVPGAILCGLFAVPFLRSLPSTRPLSRGLT